MRIVVSGYGVDASDSPLRSRIADPLRFLGHEVVAVAPTKAAIKWGLNRYSPEMLVVIPSAGSPDRSEIRTLTADSGTVSVCMHTGPTEPKLCTEFTELDDDLREYDLVSVPDRDVYEEYSAVGSYRLSLMEPATHPPALMDFVPSTRSGMLLIGDANPANIDAVATLDHLHDLLVMGEGWSELPLDITIVEPLPLPDRASLLAGVDLIIELETALSHQSAIRRSHLELGLSHGVYEAAVVGTPSLVQARPAVPQVFAPGEEIFVYESLSDLSDLAPLLLADLQELRNVGEAAWSRVTAEHTWTQRWRTFLEPWVIDPEIGRDEEIHYSDQTRSLSKAG